MKISKFKLMLVTALLFRIVISFAVWHPDVNNHVDWGTRFWEYGFKGFYDPDTYIWSYTWPNQPPGTVYIFAFLKVVSDKVFNFFWYLNVNIPIFPSNLMFYLEGHLFPAILKLPSILADFGIAFLIYKSLSDKKAAKLGALVWLLNPVVWYNSAIWGQTDSIISFLVFLSFYLLQKNKPILSVLSYALSIYVKASLLIFIPVFLLIFLKKRYKFGIYIISFLVSFTVIVLLTVPFAKGNPLVWLFYLYQGKVFVQQLQVITANAFNIWASIATIHERPQTLLLGPLSYQVWGSVFFVISYLTAVIFFLRSKIKDIYWVLAIIAFSSFMLLTNMHERYLYPLFPFFTILAVQHRKLMKIYWLISAISLLNLYNFWWYPKIGLVVNFLSFADRLMPRVLGFVLFITYIYLFKFFLRQTRVSKI